MRGNLLLFLGLAVPMVAFVAACGESGAEKAETAYCKKIAKLALKSPEDFKVVRHAVDETSEGETITVEVSYRDAAGKTVTTRERCWFSGYGKNKPLTKFYVEKDDRFVEIPDSDLAALKIKAG